MIGFYYEGGNVQDTDNDAWSLIDRAIEEASDDGRLHALMVGPMQDLSVSDLFDADDVVSMSEDGRLSAQDIAELICERASYQIHEGIASLSDSTNAKIALRRIVQAHRCAEDAAADIIQWAEEYINIDPSSYCDGRYPLPIEWIDGEWIYGDRNPEPLEAAACITYTEESSPETGHVGWCWWALGKMGEAKSLKEAMTKAEAVIQAAVEEA